MRGWAGDGLRLPVYLAVIGSWVDKEMKGDAFHGFIPRNRLKDETMNFGPAL